MIRQQWLEHGIGIWAQGLALVSVSLEYCVVHLKYWAFVTSCSLEWLIGHGPLARLRLIQGFLGSVQVLVIQD